MISVPPIPAAWSFLAGNSAAHERTRGFAWGATALGPVESWPHSTRGAIALMLNSPVPMVTLWGDAGTTVYNDAFASIIGARHPLLFGAPVLDGWPEVAEFSELVLRAGLAGEQLSFRDHEFTVQVSGRLEPVWLNLDYSPILDADGCPAGVIGVVSETTAKIRAELRVGNERERLRQMFELAPGFMVTLVGPDFTFDLVNPAFAALVGDRALAGKPVRAALPELGAQGFVELLQQVYASGVAYTGDGLPLALQRAPGGAPEQRYLDIVLQPLHDDGDAVIGIFGQGTDVTDRFAAEQAVRESEAKFRTFAQAMPNHVWSSQPDGLLDWFNDKVYEYGGAGPGELDGHRWALMVHPDDLPQAQAHWGMALAAAEPYETQFRLRGADGNYRWHIARAMPIFNDRKEVVRWVGTNTDIESQKTTAQALEYLNRTLEQQVADRTADRDRMWRLSTDVMLVADFEANIVSVNPAWTVLLGWSQAELLGRKFMDMVHPDDIAATLAEVGRLAEGATTFKFENRYRCKDGSYCLVSWTAVPDERFIHAVGRDVTADRQAARALADTEAALHQSQKMESVGQLTGGVAHDFNNLLQVIAGNLQLLRQEVAGRELAERLVGNALAGVERGAKLARQLLAFARRQPLEPRVVNVSRFVSGIEEMLRRSLGESVEIRTLVAPGLWNTFVDPAQVENALLNLAINARDAMNGVGKLTIELANAHLDEPYTRLQQDVAAGDYVLLAVTDTGAGMPPEVVARAFEPFFSTKPEGRGTGLGLSMVYGFVKQSGGHVVIYSEPGEGTTIKLYLPRSQQPEDTVTLQETRAAVGGDETVLVAEDDDDVRATVVELLRSLGYRVLQARDGPAALAIIERGEPVDLLFSDVVMPGPLRGPDLARLAVERVPDLAVLFTSGYTRNAIVHDGRLDPGVELLGKPYTQEALARKIRHVLANRAQRAVTAPPAALPQEAVTAPAAAAGMLSVLLVEDDEDVRTVTSELLGLLGCRVLEAASAAEALDSLAGQASVQVLMTDITLPDGSGLQLARQVSLLRPGIRVLVASGARPDRALEDGALYLAKPYDIDSLRGALVALVPGVTLTAY